MDYRANLVVNAMILCTQLYTVRNHLQNENNLHVMPGLSLLIQFELARQNHNTQSVASTNYLFLYIKIWMGFSVFVSVFLDKYALIKYKSQGYN